MQKTDSQLLTEANVIRDETIIGANTALRVGTMLDNLVDSKINNDKISTDVALGNDDSLVPSQNAVKTYVDGLTTGLLNDRGNYDASSNLFPSNGGSGTGGLIQKGDLWYISVAGTLGGTSVLVGYSIRALADNPAQVSANWAISNVGLGYVPEDVINKSTDVNLGTSDTYYPTQNAVKAYVDAQVASAVPSTAEVVANKSQDIITNPSSTVLYPSNKAVADYIAYGITLQAVTDSGNTTTNDIHIQNNVISADSTTDATTAYLKQSNGDSGILGVTTPGGKYGEIKGTNITDDRTYQLPDTSGTILTDAPADSQTYARNNNAWVVATNPIQTVKFSFDNAGLNGLSTAYDLIPAPGANKFIRVIAVFSNFTWGATPLTISNPTIGIGYSSVNFISCSASAVSATQPLFLPNWYFALNGGFAANYVNTALQIKSFAALTGGTGNSLDVYVTYETVTI